MNSLCIVSAGKRKVWDDNSQIKIVKAKELYTGLFTRKCIEYAQKFYLDSYCILSARYGFLYPEDKIEIPYNECFHIKNSNSISKEALQLQIKNKRLDEYDKIIVLGGKYYNQMIRDLFKGKEIINPLEGCKGIGVMIKRLNILLKDK